MRVFDYYEPGGLLRPISVSLRFMLTVRSSVDVQCTRFYTLGGGSPEVGLICDSSNKGQPACVCGAGTVLSIMVVSPLSLLPSLQNNFNFRTLSKIRKGDSQ